MDRNKGGKFDWANLSVALFARAWIETHIHRSSDVDSIVALFARAWIETP